ncbi:MAG: bacterial transcriptional activator domain-containing protein [Caldilineaceae bacterium]
MRTLLQRASWSCPSYRWPRATTPTPSPRRRILARDEVRENAYQLLMRYQAESGDSASALLTYERCRHVLSEELGADPSPLTQQLHQQILNGEVTPVHTERGGFGTRRHAPSAPEAKPVALPQHTLLPILDSRYLDVFVGRDEDLVELTQAMQHAGWNAAGSWCWKARPASARRPAYAALQHATQLGATVISATCQVLEQKLPFAALADSIGRYLRTLPDAVLTQLPGATLAILAQIVPSLQDRLLDPETGVLDAR